MSAIENKILRLPAAMGWPIADCNELQRRLDAIEELHREHDCTTDAERCQLTARFGGIPICLERGRCAECGKPQPCDTVKLARGESL